MFSLAANSCLTIKRVSVEQKQTKRWYRSHGFRTAAIYVQCSALRRLQLCWNARKPTTRLRDSRKHVHI